VQFATSSKNENRKHKGKKYIPYVFTEQGIAMLSDLLKNDIAIQVSINIMKALNKKFHKTLEVITKTWYNNKRINHTKRVLREVPIYFRS